MVFCGSQIEELGHVNDFELILAKNLDAIAEELLQSTQRESEPMLYDIVMILSTSNPSLALEVEDDKKGKIT